MTWLATTARSLLRDDRVRFLIIGGVNTFVGYGLFALVQWLVGTHISYFGSLLIAHVLASLLAFTLYRHWVFRVSGNVVGDFLRFQLVYVVPLLANLVALPLLVAFAGINVYLAQAIIVLVSSVVSYVGHKFFSFRRPTDAIADPLVADPADNGPMPVRWSTVALGALTALAWGVILLVPQSLFWDDWVTVGGDVVSLYHDLGLPWIGYLAAALSTAGPVAFKLVGVVCAVVVAIAARGIAARGLGLDSTGTWIAAALVALLPFNIARASVAVLSTYSLSLAAFFVAWWLLVAIGPHRRVRAVAASVLFFASFTTASLLPFVAVPVAHLALLEIDRSRGFWRELGRFAARYWYLLATPVLFWVVRTLFLQPRGVYAEYNSFVSLGWPLSGASAGSVLMLIAAACGGVLLVVRIFAHARQRAVDLATAILGGAGSIILATVVWWGRGSTSLSSVVTVVTIGLAGVVIILTAIVAARSSDLPRRIGHAAFLVSAGLVTFAVGALPYLLVGKTPQFLDWETRHQLLLPAGTALIAVAALAAISEPGNRRAIVARVAGGIAVGLSVVAVVAGGLSLVADWQKQAQIISALKNLDEVRTASTVVVTDATNSWNFDGRRYRFYEPIGWLHAAYGDRTRFAIEDTDADAVRSGAFDSLLDEGVRYGFDDWDRNGPVVGITIEQSPRASWWDLLVGNPAVTITPTSAELPLH